MNKIEISPSEIRTVLEQTYNDDVKRRTEVPLFISNPGMGKTYIIEQFMKDKGVYKSPFVLSQRLPYELTGMGIPNHNKEKMTYYDFDFLLELKDGDIIFIDEALNTIPQTIAALLTFLESRIMISGKKLPDIMIVAAANPQGQPMLTPQIKRRFVYYDIKFSRSDWKEFINNKYNVGNIGIPNSSLNSMCSFIEEENFSGYNFNTPADLDKAIYSTIQGYINPYSKELKPLLEKGIKNNIDDIKDGDIEYKLGEKIPWLTLKRLTENIDPDKFKKKNKK